MHALGLTGGIPDGYAEHLTDWVLRAAQPILRSATAIQTDRHGVEMSHVGAARRAFAAGAVELRALDRYRPGVCVRARLKARLKAEADA